MTTGDASDTRSRSPAGTTIATTTGYITTRTFSAGEWAACLRSRVSAGSGGVAVNVLSVSTLPMTNGSAACATLPASLSDVDCEDTWLVSSGSHFASLHGFSLVHVLTFRQRWVEREQMRARHCGFFLSFFLDCRLVVVAGMPKARPAGFPLLLSSA